MSFHGLPLNEDELRNRSYAALLAPPKKPVEIDYSKEHILFIEIASLYPPKEHSFHSHLEKNAIIEKLGESFNSSDPSSIYADIDAMVLRKLQFFDLLNISRYALMTFISKDVFRQSD